MVKESSFKRDTQDALGNKSESETRVYVQRIGIKEDRFSSKIAERLIESVPPPAIVQSSKIELYPNNVVVAAS